MSKRKISGVLLLDKAVGQTSNFALQKAKWLLHAQKAGHTGTLDPFATGLLPLCFGEATKFSQYLLDADKLYWARLKLGVLTTTADPEGDIVEIRSVNVGEADVRAALPGFTGPLMQVPPMHSALKRDGKPLYEYARAGQKVERQPRPVTIHSIELLAFDGDLCDLRVHCSKGTYVRTLAEDIGVMLGCGAHLAELRREGVGPFHVRDAVTLQQLIESEEVARDSFLRPLDCLLDALQRLDLDVDAAWQMLHGQPVWQPGLQVGASFRMHGPDGAFIGIAQVDDEGRLAPKRLIAA